MGAPGGLAPIDCPFLLTINIPVLRHAGKQYVDELWAHDLVRHLGYLKDLTVACPVIEAEPPPRCVALDDDPRFDALKIIPVRAAANTWRAVLQSPLDMWQVWRAVNEAQIVQGSPIGWPIPLGYYSYLFARLRGRFHLTILESEPWTPLPACSPTLRQRVMRRLAGIVARGSDLALCTSADMRHDLIGAASHSAHLFQASWIDERDVLAVETVMQRREQRRGRPLVIGFAGRLTEAKGVHVLLDALQRLGDTAPLDIRIVGQGELEGAVRARADSLPANVCMTIAGDVPYGERFFAELDSWDVCCVPSLSAEQPRIMFDAYARGLPVVVSDTPGLLSCIEDGLTGFSFPTGDAAQLAQTLKWLVANPAALEACVPRVHRAALQHTHSRMHAQRHELLAAAFDAWSRQRGELYH